MKKKQSELGFMTIEVMGALLVLGILLPALYSLWSHGVTEVKKRAVASHFVAVSEASINYANLYKNDLLANSTVTTGRQITIAMLQDEGFLPEAFNDENPWGQGYVIHSREPRPNELQLIILTKDGQAHEARRPEFSNIIVPSTASLASAGFIPVNDATRLQGAYNAWSIELTDYNIATTGAGHLGSFISPSQNASNDFLHRIPMPSNPELNEMQTTLDMTDHAIENVREVQFVPHALGDITADLCVEASQEGKLFLHENQGLYICRNGSAENIADTGNSALPQEMTVATNGQLITKPTCPDGTNTVPEIFLAPSLVSAGSTSPALASTQVWATSLSDAEWQVHMRVLTTDGWIYPTANYGRMWVTTMCSK